MDRAKLARLFYSHLPILASGPVFDNLRQPSIVALFAHRVRSHCHHVFASTYKLFENQPKPPRALAGGNGFFVGLSRAKIRGPKCAVTKSSPASQAFGRHWRMRQYMAGQFANFLPACISRSKKRWLNEPNFSLTGKLGIGTQRGIRHLQIWLQSHCITHRKHESNNIKGFSYFSCRTFFRRLWFCRHGRAEDDY